MRSSKSSEAAFALILVLLLPYLVYKNTRHPSSALNISWGRILLSPVAIPLRLCKRTQQRAWKALGWDKLR